MQKKARVIKCLDSGEVLVQIRRASACDACHASACSGCSTQTRLLNVSVKNTIGARAGDEVLVSTPSSAVLTAAAIVYLLPILLFFAGYALFALLGANGALGGGLGFLLALGVAIAVNAVFKKQGKLQYMLTDFTGE